MTSGDDGNENVAGDAEDGNEDISEDQLSKHWMLGQTYTTQLKDENNEAPATGRRPSDSKIPSIQGIQRTSPPPPQTLLPEVPQLIIQEKKVSGAVLNAFDTHIQSMNDKLLTKLDAVERLTEESKKMDRQAAKAVRRKSGTFAGKIDSLTPLNPLSEFDDDLLEIAEKSVSRQFRGRRISDLTGYSSNSQLNSADASLSGSTHGLSMTVEHLEDVTKDTATVSTTGSSYASTSTPKKHLQTTLRSMSIGDVDISGLVPGSGLGLRAASARGSEGGLMDVIDDSMEDITRARLAGGGTKTGVTVPTLSIGITTSSSSPPLPMLVSPNAGGGGSLIRRSSSRDLEALVPIDATSNRSSPGIAAMIASASTRLTYEEMSRPPENEDDIDYGDSQGFKPIQKIPARRGSKTLGLDERGEIHYCHCGCDTCRGCCCICCIC